MGREGMRAGDSDRQAVADQLKRALDEGRLDLGEYDERLQRTYGAKTFADLDGLLDDLPGAVPPQHSQVQPAATVPQPAVVTGRSAAHQVARWVGPYGGVIVICILIWAVTSLSAHRLTYFWPLWMLIPLGFGVMGQWFRHDDTGYAARRAARDERRARRRGY